MDASADETAGHSIATACPDGSETTGTGRVPLMGLVAFGVLLLGCSSPTGQSTLLTEANAPVAIVALPSGGLRYAERATGRVREIARLSETEGD